MFCCLRFKFDFYQTLWPFWSHMGFRLTPFFRKKPFRKSLQKKGTPHLKNPGYGIVQGLPETPPLIILYKGRRLAGALNSVQFNSIQAQFNSNSIQIELELEMAVWVGFEVEKFLENCWLSLVSIGKVSKESLAIVADSNKSKNGKVRYQKHSLLMIWTRHWAEARRIFKWGKEGNHALLDSR